MQVVIEENAGYTFSIFSILPINPRPASYTPRMHVVQQVQVFLSNPLDADLEFVKKFTRPNFCAKVFYTVKTRKLRLFSPAINSENASLIVIWPTFSQN